MSSKKINKSLKIFALLLITVLVGSLVPAWAMIPTQEQVNDYAAQTSSLIEEKCNGNCESVVILGDDYVVPSYRNTFPMENGISFGWKFFKDPSNPTILTDNPFVPKHAAFEISEMQEIFNDCTKGACVEKSVLIITPSGMSSDMQDAVDSFKNVVQYKFRDRVSIKPSSEIDCDDLNLYSATKDKTIVIIGDETTNQALSCYPSVEPDEDSMYVDVNVWSPNHPALIIKSNDVDVVAFFAFFIQIDQYKTIHSQKMTVVDVALIAGGTSLIIVGAVSSATGAGATWGVPLMYMGFAIDAASIANECVVKNAGGDNWVSCGITSAISVAAPFAGYGIGKALNYVLVKGLLKNMPLEEAQIVLNNFNRLKGQVGESSLFTLVRQARSAGGDDAAVLFVKRVSKGVQLAESAYGKDLASILKTLPSSMDDMAKARFFAGVGRIGISHGDEIAKDFITLYATKYGGFNTITESSLDKLDDYIRLADSNPFRNADATRNVVRIFDSPNTKIVLSNGREVTQAAVLREGVQYGPNSGFGWKHMVEEGHNAQIMKEFGLADSEQSIINFIQEGLEKGVKGADGNILYQVSGKKSLLIVMGRDSDKVGTIITAFPTG
jgi:hypothetical protein